MFIILSHTCSRISYITDCTLKKDNNQVNPLLPRHIPAEASDIHHISRVHSDYRIGRSVLHALRYGSCHFQLTSALEYASVCPMEIHDMQTAGNIANLTVA